MDKHLITAYCLVVCIGMHMTGVMGHRRASSEEISPTTTETVTVGGVAGCPSGFQRFESSCYRLVSDSPINWLRAQTECQKLASDSHLAFIQSQTEMTFLVGLAKGQGANRDYWFGLTYTADRDHPHWLDGSPLGSFTAWDDYGVFDGDNSCVRLRRDSDYLWNDRKCHMALGYICELEKSNDDVIPLTTPSPKTDVIPPTTPSPKAAAPPTPTVRSAEFKASPSNMAAPIGNNHLLQRIQTPSLIRCAKYCLKHNACTGFNYQFDQSQSEEAAVGDKLHRFCELFSKEFSNEELITRRGYKNYRALNQYRKGVSHSAAI